MKNLVCSFWHFAITLSIYRKKQWSANFCSAYSTVTLCFPKYILFWAWLILNYSLLLCLKSESCNCLATHNIKCCVISKFIIYITNTKTVPYREPYRRISLFSIWVYEISFSDLFSKDAWV